MNLLAEKINDYAEHHPREIAIYGDSLNLNYIQLIEEIDTLIPQLNAHNIGLMMDNGPAWAIADLAMLFSHKCIVPLPLFFSQEQLNHAIEDAQIELIISTQDYPFNGSVKAQKTIQIAATRVNLFFLPVQRSSKPFFSGKITYTSGTSGTPKGVMLSHECILNKASALAKATQAVAQDRVLSLLPLSTLLENIGGIYVPLLCGAAATLYATQAIGFKGSSQVDEQQLLKTISQVRPSAFIIIPQLLMLFIKAYQHGFCLPPTVRFIAIGGAPISKQLLNLATGLKIPVYEGYGLSEAASVVSLNHIQEQRLGSVGKPLENHRIKLAEDGEILLQGRLFEGYLGDQPIDSNDFYHSGDLGHFDEDGFLYIDGRKRNVIISSYGRNISPEWLEKELDAIPLVAQSVVYGEAKPSLMAILVLRPSSFKATQIKQILNKHIQQLNQLLPDYARIKHFIIAEHPFASHNKQLTATGRPVREHIFQDYQFAINQSYEKTA